ncbi:MAG: ABC transporter permease [Vicinamibacterales bacterium]
MDTLLGDLRFALRWLRRSPAFLAVAVASLGIGIAFNATLFAVVDAILLRPLPVQAPDRLVDLYTSGSDGDPWNTSSYPDYRDLRDRNHVFSGLAGHSAMVAAVGQGDRSRLVLGEVVTGNFFEVLGVRAAIGRMLAASDDRDAAERVVVIAHRYWMRELGGAADVVGRTIRIGSQPYTIVGVAPDRFNGMVPLLAAEMWVPVRWLEEIEPAGIIDAVPSPGARTRLERRGYRWMFLKGRLRDGASLDQAKADLDVLMAQLRREHGTTNKDRRLSLKATKDVRLHPAADGPLAAAAAGLMIAVGLVLAIACANVASMLLARASARQREMSVRLAIGASRGDLVRQLLVESVLLSLAGGTAGTLLAAWAIRAIGLLEPPFELPLSLDLRLDGRVLAFAFGVSTLAGLIAGLMPALKASSPSIAGDLRGGATEAMAAGRRWTLRDALVIGQMATTVVLLVSGALLARSLAAARHADVGFDTASLAIVGMDLENAGYGREQGPPLYARALERLRQIPGVRQAALSSRLPFSLNFNIEQIWVPGVHQPGDRGTPTHNARVSAEYFEALGIPLIEGRLFTGADTPDSPPVIVINETMARRYWPKASAVGQRVRLRDDQGPFFEVVGVVANHKVQTVGEAEKPYMHFAYSQQPGLYQVLVVRGRGDGQALLAAVERELLALERNLLFMGNMTMDAQIAATLYPLRVAATLVGGAGTVAMVLAAIGLYGVIAYSVARRTREIGVRMALGAARSSVLGLVMRQGLTVAVVGLVAGCVLAFLATRALSGILYGVTGADPVAWGGAAAVLLTIAALANLIPAQRAARIQPTVALRVE